MGVGTVAQNHFVTLGPIHSLAACVEQNMISRVSALMINHAGRAVGYHSIYTERPRADPCRIQGLLE